MHSLCPPPVARRCPPFDGFTRWTAPSRADHTVDILLPSSGDILAMVAIGFLKVEATTCREQACQELL